MKDSKSSGLNHDHHAIQRNKLGSILHNRIPPSTRHFCNAVHASREDGYERQCQTAQKRLKVEIVLHIRGLQTNVFVLRDSRNAKSTDKDPKPSSVKICGTMPAIISPVPTLRRLPLFAVVAMPPPQPCKTREKISAVMKTQV
jgi:hypothetical protein